MNAIHTSLIAEPSAIVSLLSPIILGTLVTFVLLLSHPKTRKTAWIMVAAVGVIAVLLVGGLFVGWYMLSVASHPNPIVRQQVPMPIESVPHNTSSIQLHEDMAQKAPTATSADTTTAPGPSFAEKPAVDQGGGEGTPPTLSQGERGPSQRPAWIDAPPQLIGDAYQMSISVGPYTTRAECDAKLPDELQAALGRYVEACLGDQAARDIRLPADYLRRQLVKAEWEEVRPFTVGFMTQLHVLLQFDRKVKDRVLEAHREAVVGDRLQAVAGWAAIGLLLLTVLFAYLKIDLATGGVYRGRLRFATGVAILGLVAAAVAVV